MTAVVVNDKKHKIITTVQEILAEKGYTATTINEIARKAQISRGLLHYYFKNKEEMIVEALRTAIQTSISQGRDLFLQAQDVKILAAGITGLLKQLVLEYPVFFRLLFEGWSASLQSSVIKDEVGFLYQQFIDIIKEGLDFLKTRNIIAEGTDTAQTALMLTGLFDGLGMLALNKPEQVNARLFWETVEKTVYMILR